MSDNKEALPIVVLCGRPNVGKSTLFNRLIKSNRAITHDMPGVTRDRMEGIVRRKGLKPFEIVDTGGITLDAAANVADGPQGIRGFEAEILAQADEALSRAAAVAFVVDGKDGLLPLDEHLAAHIRRKNMPVLCVVNKVDGLEREDEQRKFWECPTAHFITVKRIGTMCRGGQCPPLHRNLRIGRFLC